MSSRIHIAAGGFDARNSKISAASAASNDDDDQATQYRDFSTEDVSLLNEKMPEEDLYRPRKMKGRLLRLLRLWVFFFALAIFSLATYILLPSNINQIPEFHPVFGDCGKTPQEARANGCKYDLLAVSWVRPQCYYPELIDEFIDMESVRFYFDKSLSEGSHVPTEEVYQGLHEMVWAPHKFHSVHCAHVVKKVHHALARRLPIDDFSLGYSHTAHCQLVLLEELPSCAKPGSCQLNTVIQNYSSCGYVY